MNQTSDMTRPARYRICVGGSVPPDWTGRCLGMAILPQQTSAGPRSILEGVLPDQPALAGILAMLHEARYPVICVICLDDPTTNPDSTPAPSTSTTQNPGAQP